MYLTFVSMALVSVVGSPTDGPPLPLGQQLRGPRQPQALHALFVLGIRSECVRTHPHYRQVHVVLDPTQVSTPPLFAVAVIRLVIAETRRYFQLEALLRRPQQQFIGDYATGGGDSVWPLHSVHDGRPVRVHFLKPDADRQTQERKVRHTGGHRQPTNQPKPCTIFDEFM